MELRRLDPNGEPFQAGCFAFGNLVGQQVKHVTRAWYAAVRRAHGHTPTYADCRAALADIDLHFHDLRCEPGSRWMDGGIPLGTIQRWLGHKSISHTSTSLKGTPASDHDALRQYQDRLASLQQPATPAWKGGRKSPPAAKRREEMLNKSTGSRQSAIR